MNQEVECVGSLFIIILICVCLFVCLFVCFLSFFLSLYSSFFLSYFLSQPYSYIDVGVYLFLFGAGHRYADASHHSHSFSLG